MGFIVVDTTIDDKHKFYIIGDHSSLVEWHMSEFGHFYKVFSSAEEFSVFFDKYDFGDSSFEDEAKGIIKNNQSVVITSCSPNESHFVYAVKCHSKNESSSEAEFIIKDCPMLCDTEIYKREVYDYSYVLDSFRLESQNLVIRHSVFGTRLLYFLEQNNLLFGGRDKYWAPDINENPHKQAVLSSYLFRQHYEQSNLGLMEYWDCLHPNDREYCREIVKKINFNRDEWEHEISESK